MEIDEAVARLETRIATRYSMCNCADVVPLIAELRRLREMEQRVDAGLVNSSRMLGEYQTMCQKLGDLLGVPGGKRHLDTLVPAVEKLVKSDTALSEK